MIPDSSFSRRVAPFSVSKTWSPPSVELVVSTKIGIVVWDRIGHRKPLDPEGQLHFVWLILGPHPHSVVCVDELLRNDQNVGAE